MRRALRRVYGGGPGHLAAMAVCFAFFGYAAYAIFQNPNPWSIAIWLAGAIIVHDFVLVPIYTGAYRLVWRTGRVSLDRPRRVAALHHAVVPAAVSVLLLIMWLPLILRLSESGYRATTGMSQEPFLWRWLALTAVLFAVSALLYRRRVARMPDDDSEA